LRSKGGRATRTGTAISRPTHNEALHEAYAACPPSAQIFCTLEIWQSSFDAPARVVANVGDMVLGIEVGAPRMAARW
jgi:hypothetical protein